MTMIKRDQIFDPVFAYGGLMSEYTVEYSAVINPNLYVTINQSPVYKRWKNNLLENFNVEKIIIHNIFMFGSRVGFMMVESVCFDKETNQRVPGIAFLRGDSVSIMPVIKCEGETYTVMVTEARTPIGSPAQTALPAGMTDGMSFTSAAIKELEEEVGPEFAIGENELKFLGNFSVTSGGSDEKMGLYFFEKEVGPEVLEKINGRITGAENENESIKVSVVKIEELKNMAGTDMRSVLSYYLWKDYNDK